MRPAWVLGAIGALAVAIGSGLARADLPLRRGALLLEQPVARRALAASHGKVPLLVPLPAGVGAADRGLLEVAPGWGAVRLAPSELAGFLVAHPDLEPRWAPPRHPLLDVASTWTHANELREETGLDGAGVVVGLVDTGLDVVHPDFRRADGRSRVRWMLLAGAPAGRHAALESDLGCDDPRQTPCYVLDADDVDELVASADTHDEPRDPSGHGTHVLSIAAGNGGPMTTDTPHYVGVAPAASLVVAAPSDNGAFSDPDILRAVSFVFDRADDMGLPAVVNVSLGSDFGPHDGTSSLEKGLAAMVGPEHPGRVIVVAAGNSATLVQMGDQGPFGIHTEAHVSPNGTTRVPFSVPGWAGTLSGAVYVWLTFEPGDEISVALEGPDGESWVGRTDAGDSGGYESDDGAVRAGVVNNSPEADSDISPDTNSAVVVVDGAWEGSAELALLLEGHGHAQLWVTPTGDFEPGTTGSGMVFSKALRAGTVGIPATHAELLAVGCSINRVRWRPKGTLQLIELSEFGGVADPQPDGTCYFSGAGPTATGLLKPDITAPGAWVAAAMSRDATPSRQPNGLFASVGCPAGLPACQVVDDWHAVTLGTSMSAPHVVGATALLLQRDPSLTQPEIVEILQAGAARPTGLVPYDYQLGPGELDLLGALQVLDQSSGGSAVPDAGQSFYVLSAPYLRPDRDAAVQAVVQLRTADGSLALRTRAAELAVRLRNAELVSGPEHTSAGTWRFSLTAPEGSGGSVAWIDVQYGGRSLGVRALPIGVDEWTARSVVDAVGGGCAVGHDHAVRPAWPIGAFVSVALGCARLGRRRRRRPTSP